ncbi:hypothetical protein OSB04_029751 [Centaurea solstitialis]|uniref:G-patch domain-containing protein n=1 Tax=Centaurea solstitialis TaxID=347529 RepID=A0AA38SDU5_9ASTR|nr:hypothetical protein OSB04_029751 [Centaurea solstitialis]
MKEKLSFSLSSSSSKSKPPKSTSQIQHHQSTKIEFLTEFDPSSKTLPDSTSKTPLIIPPIPNQWNPKSKIEPNPNSKNQNSGHESTSPIDRLMLYNLKMDLERLPEDRGLEEFEDVPIEKFGAGLLKGYGWYEGRGIGKNAMEDVKVVQYAKWNAKEGLGFIERVWKV